MNEQAVKLRKLSLTQAIIMSQDVSPSEAVDILSDIVHTCVDPETGTLQGELIESALFDEGYEPDYVEDVIQAYLCIYEKQKLRRWKSELTTTPPGRGREDLTE